MDKLNILNLIYDILGLFKIPTIELCNFDECIIEEKENEQTLYYTPMNDTSSLSRNSLGSAITRPEHVLFALEENKLPQRESVIKEHSYIPVDNPSNYNLVTENYLNNTYEYKGKSLPQEFFIDKGIFPNEMSEKHLDMIFLEGGCMI